MGRPKKIKTDEKQNQSKTSLKVKELAQKYSIKFADEFKVEPKIKTGIFALDYILSGGISQCQGGHRIEFFGAESSGKTTFALRVVARYQKLNKKCVFLDSEGAFDPDWATVLGVDCSKLVIAYPEYLEQAGDLLVELINDFDLIVVDSIPSLIPKAELDDSMEHRNMALQAQLNSPLTRKLYNKLSNKNVTLIFINQIREKVGFVFGNPETVPGGRALKHFYNTRIRFKNTEFIEENNPDSKKKLKIGVVNTLQAVKNKKGKPNRIMAVDFYYDGRIDNQKSLFFAGLKLGIIQKMGTYYEYNKIRAQGKDKFCFKLTDEHWREIENDIWKNLK